MKFAWIPIQVYEVYKNSYNFYSIKSNGWAWLSYVDVINIYDKFYYIKSVKDYK
jgi:hypothetical protein